MASVCSDGWLLMPESRCVRDQQPDPSGVMSCVRDRRTSLYVELKKIPVSPRLCWSGAIGQTKTPPGRLWCSDATALVS